MAKHGLGRRPGARQHRAIHYRSHQRANRPAGGSSRGAVHRRHAHPCQRDPGRYYDLAIGGHRLVGWRRDFRQRRRRGNSVAQQPSRYPQHRQQRRQSRHVGDTKRRGRISRSAHGICRRHHCRERASRHFRRHRRHLQRSRQHLHWRHQRLQYGAGHGRYQRCHHRPAEFDGGQPDAVRRSHRHPCGYHRAATRTREDLHQPGRGKPGCGTGQQRQSARHHRHRAGRQQPV